MNSDFFTKMAREFTSEEAMDQYGADIALAVKKAYLAGQRRMQLFATDPKIVTENILREISSQISCSAGADISSDYYALVRFGDDDISLCVTKCQKDMPSDEQFFSVHVVNSTGETQYDLYTCECTKEALLSTITDIQETLLAELSFEEPDSGPVIPPGETIADIMKERNVSIESLSHKCEIPIEILNGEISGESPITPSIAVSLEKNFGVPKSFWLNLQHIYDEEHGQ